MSIAEVMRDLYRDETAGEQSYSERQSYKVALDRLAREIAAIESIDADKAVEKLEGFLNKKAA